MKLTNRKIAIFGIVTYVLSVLTSVESLEGDPLAPVALILISGVATTAFTIMATVRLWKEAKNLSIGLAVSTITLFILEANQEFTQPSYGSPIIILLNITKVISFIIFVWAIVKLFKSRAI